MATPQVYCDEFSFGICPWSFAPPREGAVGPISKRRTKNLLKRACRPPAAPKGPKETDAALCDPSQHRSSSASTPFALWDLRDICTCSLINAFSARVVQKCVNMNLPVSRTASLVFVA